jgi:HSP20 family protein
MQKQSEQNVETQEIPANVYQSDERVMIAAPMPGVEPQNITVSVSDGPMVTLHADLRGALKGDKDIVMDEWTPGPYHRELELPTNVDGAHANVTYNNGVLVVALPVSDQTTAAELSLDAVTATQGKNVGNRGRKGNDDIGRR